MSANARASTSEPNRPGKAGQYLAVLKPASLYGLSLETCRPRPSPPNALSGGERGAVLDALHAPRFADKAPAQVWATLLDEGTCLGSESTMYRLLRSNGEIRERRRQASHPARTVPELVASRPREVWSYDATALRGPARGSNYDLFVMLDLFCWRSGRFPH